MKTQRDEILQIIRDSCYHMTADEIYLACRTNGLNTSLATVYRNLGIMAENKTLRRFSVPGKPDIFDITVADHGHKVCRLCGTVSDIDDNGLKADLEERLGIDILDYNLCLQYICPSCGGKGSIA